MAMVIICRISTGRRPATACTSSPVLPVLYEPASRSTQGGASRGVVSNTPVSPYPPSGPCLSQGLWCLWIWLYWTDQDA